MNERIFNRCIEVAKALRPNIKSGKAHHCSFAISKSRIICIGVNDYKTQHPYHKFGVYKNNKGYSSGYKACKHSEVDLAIKLGLSNWSGLEIVNIRIGNKGDVRLAKPCCNCKTIIIDAMMPKRMYYSDNDGKSEQLELA